MSRRSGLNLLLFVQIALLCSSISVKAEPLQAVESATVLQAPHAGDQWTAANVEHIYGLPEIKQHKRGSLTLSADNLTFTGKSGSTAIPRSSITAVSAGNERVELWGITGRILRMAIPDNGGLAIAAFAHHRIDMLTVEFNDARGGAHSAVFFLGANQAAHAIEAFAIEPRSSLASLKSGCQSGATETGSMLITSPNWDGVQVPAVYQGLVYEHLVERFRKAKSLKQVYRDGERIPEGMCPQYTVHLSVTGFKEGSSVKRAMLGPVGMFVGTTQMIFDAELSDRSGSINIKEELKSTIRGENESTSVADQVAKKLEKKYEKAVKASVKQSRAH